MTYCEIGALAVRPEYRGTGRNLLQKAIELINSGNELKADIFIADSRPITLAHQSRIGLRFVENGVIRADSPLYYNKKNICYPIVLSPNKDLPLATADMVASGAITTSSSTPRNIRS